MNLVNVLSWLASEFSVAQFVEHPTGKLWEPSLGFKSSLETLVPSSLSHARDKGIYHLSYSISTQDTFDIADQQVQDPCYIKIMNLVNGLAHQLVLCSSVCRASDWQIMGTITGVQILTGDSLSKLFVPRS